MADKCDRCGELELARARIAELEAQIQARQDDDDEKAEYVAMQQRTVRELRAARKRKEPA